MADYLSPAAAFSDSIEDFLVKQQALKHQMFMDDIARRREDRQEKRDDLDLQLRRDEMTQRNTESNQRIHDKRVDSFLKQQDELGVGDVPPAHMVKEAQSLGLPLRLGAAPTVSPGQSQVQMPGQTVDPMSGKPMAQAPVQMPGAQGPQSFEGARPYLGSPQQEKIQKILGILGSASPDSPEFRRAAVEYEVLTGRSISSSMINGPKAGAATDEPVARQNPRTGKVERLQNGQWVPVMGDVPKGTHFMTVPAPPAANINVPVFRVSPDGKLEQMGSTPKGAKIINPPGASQEAQKSATRKTGMAATSRLKSDIQEAAQMGLIGPGAGRWYQALAKLGSTGDPKKDALIGRLKGDILLTKMHVDAGIGGTRAASSPLLLKNWEDIAMSGSADLLLGYLSAIESDMQGQGVDAPPAGTTPPPNTGRGNNPLGFTPPAK